MFPWREKSLSDAFSKGISTNVSATDVARNLNTYGIKSIIVFFSYLIWALNKGLDFETLRLVFSSPYTKVNIVLNAIFFFRTGNHDSPHLPYVSVVMIHPFSKGIVRKRSEQMSSEFVPGSLISFSALINFFKKMQSILKLS